MDSITILDDLWMGRPHTIATALLESGGHRAVIDPGPGSTLATLREQLETRGLGVGDLEAVLLTHIHLDHAGATGALVRENPRLAVYVHKNGAPHMIDFNQAEHITFMDNTAGMRIEGNSYVMPATPPPDIDLDIWDKSFAAIFERNPARLFLTHLDIPTILPSIFYCFENGCIAGPRSPRKSCAPPRAIPRRWIRSCPPRLRRFHNTFPPAKPNTTLSALA